MARVKVESIVDHCSSEFTRALADALNQCNAGGVDERELFRAFKRACGRRFPVWQRVPDRYVELET